jgi:hypothetical protein
VPARRIELPERQARLKDGRTVQIRHGRAGDEAGIARLLAAAFPVYARAARRDGERAVRSLAREVRPEAYVVAVLAAEGRLVGVSCMSGHGATEPGRWQRIRTKLDAWGVYGLLCFGVEKLRARLFEAGHRVRPGELYRHLDAVEVGCRSLGVSRHVTDFVEDYGRAAGHHTVSARHRADNQPVLALHRKRGCVLVESPRPPLARLFRQPPMLVSSRALSEPPRL